MIFRAIIRHRDHPLLHGVIDAFLAERRLADRAEIACIQQPISATEEVLVGVGDRRQIARQPRDFF
ncbi:hypothetical protein D3C86_2017140 [compost metagenome]